jgi:hypothetical protein
MSSTFYFWPPQRHFNAQQMLPKNYVAAVQLQYHIGWICRHTNIIQDTQCYALLQTPTKYHCYFFQIEPLLNFQIFRASFDKRQSVIEYEIFM